jgi:hypothetical protein
LLDLLLGERERGQAMNYEQGAELLTIKLRRNEILGLAWSCRQTGKEQMAQELEKMAERESN